MLLNKSLGQVPLMATTCVSAGWRTCISALVAGKAAEVARSRESACHDDILLYHTILLNASTRKMAYCHVCRFNGNSNGSLNMHEVMPARI